MDISPIYLKMCEAAEEVQAHRFVDVENLKKNWEDGDWGRSHKGRVEVYHGWYFSEALSYREMAEWTWLPTQAQLQSMVYHKHPRWIGLLLFFGDWLADETSSEDETSTPEQLWLRYTMSALYNKFWNGFKWERDPKFEMFEKKED